MRTYVIYDRETGDVMHTLVSPGPLTMSDELIELLVASGGLERAAFVEVHPSRLPLRTVTGDTASLSQPPPTGSSGLATGTAAAPLRHAV